VALLHVERAATGLGDWDTAHTRLATAAASPISTGPQATLLFGAPALAFALHAAADRPGRYEHGRRRPATLLPPGHLPPARLTGPTR
jgi:hypothetical protein